MKDCYKGAISFVVSPLYLSCQGSFDCSFRWRYCLSAAGMGTDLKTLQSIAGHADIQTTINRYVHKQTDKISETGNRLQTLFG